MKTFSSCINRLCGADDCPLCHPENFKPIEGVLVYIDDWPSPPPVFHNPEHVPSRYLGDGYRFCTVEEVPNPPADAEMFISLRDWRSRGEPGSFNVELHPHITYRTRTPLPE